MPYSHISVSKETYYYVVRSKNKHLNKETVSPWQYTDKLICILYSRQMAANKDSLQCINLQVISVCLLPFVCYKGIT